MTVKQELITFYSNKSKHSNYQVLPTVLKKILQNTDVKTKTRLEMERIAYILSKLDVRGKSILDIGGNTGYFIFELVNAGAKTAHLYEGNKEHSDFVHLAAKALGLENIKVTNGYFSFDGEYNEHHDVTLLLNVLHHVGDDYDNQNLTIVTAKKRIIDQLNSLSKQTKTLVFQLGFNWHGNPANCLFENGTKKEMIDYIKNGISKHWDIVAIGVAEQKAQKIVYADLNEKNIERDDTLGEFLNRPLFILKSKKTL